MINSCLVLLPTSLYFSLTTDLSYALSMLSFFPCFAVTYFPQCHSCHVHPFMLPPSPPHPNHCLHLLLIRLLLFCLFFLCLHLLLLLLSSTTSSSTFSPLLSLSLQSGGIDLQLGSVCQAIQHHANPTIN